MREPRWLNDEEKHAWYAFLAAGALVNRQVEQQLKTDAGLSHPQYEILVRLADTPDGSLRMTDLANALLTTKSGLTYQVDRLEKLGFVARRACPTDDRSVFAVLTDAGRERLGDAAPGHVAAVREALVDVLTPAQLACLADALGTVARRLQSPDA